MLKCGQKDNKKYTFGVRKEQIEEMSDRKSADDLFETKKCCSSCGSSMQKTAKFCSSCGEKI